MPTNDYDSRMANLEKRIRKADMNEKNRGLFWEFNRDFEVQNYLKGWIYKLLNYLKIMGEQIDFDFEDATEEDIKDTAAWLNERYVAGATEKDTKIILKMFYKWLNGGEYPDKVKWIDTTRKRSNSILLKNVLAEEDMRKLIEAANNSRDETLMDILWETEGFKDLETNLLLNKSIILKRLSIEHQSYRDIKSLLYR